MLLKTKRYYSENLQIKYGEPKGATAENIDEIERKLDCRLPESLREYLFWGGCHSDGPFIGTDCFASDILENTGYLPGFLSENRLSNPRDDEYVVFYSHQGYVLAWIYVSDGDNPEVYYFAEGGAQVIAKEKTIDEWFYKNLLGLNCGSY